MRCKDTEHQCQYACRAVQVRCALFAALMPESYIGRYVICYYQLMRLRERRYYIGMQLEAPEDRCRRQDAARRRYRNRVIQMPCRAFLRKVRDAVRAVVREPRVKHAAPVAWCASFISTATSCARRLRKRKHTFAPPRPFATRRHARAPYARRACPQS